MKLYFKYITFGKNIFFLHFDIYLTYIFLPFFFHVGSDTTVYTNVKGVQENGKS